MNRHIYKLFCLLLCLSIIFSFASCKDKSRSADGSRQQQQISEPISKDPICLIACSDFQNYGGSAEAAKTFGELLDSAKNSCQRIDGFLFAGDYHTDIAQYVGTASSQDGLDTLRQTLYARYDKGFYEAYAEGNHDIMEVDGISKSGSADPESGSFGVFIINEDDYMWKSDTAWSESNSGSGLNSAQIIRKTSESLDNYLSAKANGGFTKPIFILSHLPLHYSMRTRLDGDGMYADMLFDVINGYGKRGLNIVFLFGHDHSNGWDDYLGGSSIFLTKGDSINIARSSKNDFKTDELAFTYMNAGYVGYYENHNGCDDALTVSVFEINDDSLIISRFDKDGQHDLKSAGVPNFYKGEKTEYYKPDKRVISGSVTVELSKEIKPAKPKDATDSDTDMQSPAGINGELPRITKDADSLEEGSYLLLYDDNQLMANSLAERDGSSGKRIGFELIAADISSVSIGDYASCLWELKKSGNGWKICCGNKSVKLTETQDKGIIVELSETGDDFLITGGEGRYTFSNGKYVLNYNSRGLINGYANQPAEFELYKVN